MKKVSFLALALTVSMAALVLKVNAEDLASQISALQLKAERVESQINQARQQTDSQVDQQVKALISQIDNLVKQRVQLDSQIAKLEVQADEIKNSSKANLSKQIRGYDQELISLKQQISSLNAKKWAEEAQKLKEQESQQNK
jgi:hypothetical protein